MNYGSNLEFEKESLILRDYLAADRTALSIDRTILSYIRTALTTFVAGISLIKFFDSFFLHLTGWLLMGATFLVITIGFKRVWEMKKFVSQLKETDEKKLNEESSQEKLVLNTKSAHATLPSVK
jgi:putative membrane protein